MKKAFPLKQTLFAIVCIIAGSIIYYLWGYKDNTLVTVTALGLTGLGWLIISTNVKDAYLKVNKQWYRKLAVFLLFTILIPGNFIIMMWMEDNRVETILNSGKTKTTIGIVTKLEERKKKGGKQPYATITYQTDAISITRDIYNTNRKYKAGEKLEIKYSLDYPEMIKVTGILSEQ